MKILNFEFSLSCAPVCVLLIDSQRERSPLTPPAQLLAAPLPGSASSFPNLGQTLAGLTFQLGDYFWAQGAPSSYLDKIPIHFIVEPDSGYHIPLAYSTYRSQIEGGYVQGMGWLTSEKLKMGSNRQAPHPQCRHLCRPGLQDRS